MATEPEEEVEPPRRETRVNSRRNSGTVARFIEDDAVVEMIADGQSTDFVEDEPGRVTDGDGSQDSQAGEDEPASSGDEDEEVILNSQASRGSQRSRGSNNNATVAAVAMEEGECDDSQGLEQSQLQKRRSDDQLKDFKQYVDQKFDALSRMVELERQLTEKNRELDQIKAKGKASQGKNNYSNDMAIETAIDDGRLELTVYRNAVEREKSKRGSSSSEDMVNTSNELDNEEELVRVIDPDISVSEREMQNQQEKDRRNNKDQTRRRDQYYEQEPRPQTSRQGGGDRERRENFEARSPVVRRDVVGEKARRIVNDAESAKARIYDLPGNQFNIRKSFDEFNQEKGGGIESQIRTAVEMDEDYRLVASHVDAKLRAQILNHEYIDFSKLLPRMDRVASLEEDSPVMQMVNRGGVTGSAPAPDRMSSINSYSKWEQAFRVFSDIYTEAYPGRSTELIQYNHVIHSASVTFAWDNVYTYDREFRKHMYTHPSRNWGVILNMAYTMYIKDRISHNYAGGRGDNYNNNRNNGASPAEMKKRKPCFGFNSRGNCSYGSRCRFDHRCGFCNKFGHGVYSCRKLNSLSAAEREAVLKKFDKGSIKQEK